MQTIPNCTDCHEHVTQKMSRHRLVHSTIFLEFSSLVNEHRFTNGALRLSDHFNRPGIIEECNNMADLTRGMSYQPEKASDQYFDAEVREAFEYILITGYKKSRWTFHLLQITEFLFRMGRPLGVDLRAIDIHRNRDHGLASYNSFREYCGLPRAKFFADFTDYISLSVSRSGLCKSLV